MEDEYGRFSNPNPAQFGRRNDRSVALSLPPGRIWSSFSVGFVPLELVWSAISCR
jgi:hypothetical protein